MLGKMSKLLRSNVQQCRLYLAALYFILEICQGGKAEVFSLPKKKKKK